MKIIYDAHPESFYDVYELHNSSINYIFPKEEFRICRYCTNTSTTKFKSKAHLLPEFTGNKDLFCYNECDDCNKKFGLYETNLSAFSGIKNTFVPIKGKKKYPKFKDDFTKFSSQFQEGNKVIANATDETSFMKFENGVLNIESVTQPFVPLYVYKALVKFAISMMKKEELFKFKKTLEWLNEPKAKIDNFIPLLLIHNEGRPPIIKPIAILAKRKLEINAPEFSFIFAFGFHRLQIFIPFNINDEKLKSDEIILPLNFEFVLQKQSNTAKWGFGHFDMNSLRKIRLNDNFKLNFKPSPNSPFFNK